MTSDLARSLTCIYCMNLLYTRASVPVSAADQLDYAVVTPLVNVCFDLHVHTARYDLPELIISTSVRDTNYL